MSIVIPTLNRKDCLTNTVKDLLGQDYLNFEIVIVDQSPEKDIQLFDYLESHAGVQPVRYYHVDFKGLPQARNFGWQVSKFDLVIFVDDDVIIPNGFISEHVKSHQDLTIGVVAGGIFEVYRKDNPKPIRPGHFNYWTATPTRDFNSLQSGCIQSAGGGNFSVHKLVFEKASGFDENLSLGAALYEETEFCLRTIRWGFKVWFAPRAALKHLAHPTGGCRVDEVPNYTWSLARNRMIVILRNLQWYHLPTAIGRVLLLILSYARSSRNLETIKRGLLGLWAGYKVASMPPLVSSIDQRNIKFEKIFFR